MSLTLDKLIPYSKFRKGTLFFQSKILEKFPISKQQAHCFEFPSSWRKLVLFQKNKKKIKGVDYYSYDAWDKWLINPHNQFYSDYLKQTVNGKTIPSLFKSFLKHQKKGKETFTLSHFHFNCKNCSSCEFVVEPRKAGRPLLPIESNVNTRSTNQTLTSIMSDLDVLMNKTTTQNVEGIIQMAVLNNIGILYKSIEKLRENKNQWKEFNRIMGITQKATDAEVLLWRNNNAISDRSYSSLFRDLHLSNILPTPDHIISERKKVDAKITEEFGLKSIGEKKKDGDVT
eukprot:TRINITY_DN7257_c0_g1_i1.p1 TRINITY_DN7257_c0_g1~~TRINITY_DN7257_c0_g1_i1.p1  ORF type:complete len:286 (+),score=21.87 TRINITY_DN7257_c0_g1_i1:42-899(+)